MSEQTPQVTSLFEKPTSAPAPEAPTAAPVPETASASPQAPAPEAPVRRPKPHIPLDVLAAEVATCHKCPLAEGRTHTVFGVGNPDARVLIVGEAPGKNEDLQGEPFVGAAGKYLNELLAIAGLRREDVYIANVLKCRPPGNRDPRPEEIEVCTPYLREQTRTINPEYIVTLGNFSTKFILKTEVGITRLHGKLQQAGRFKVFPIFHPAAALYDMNKRAALEDDFYTLGQLLAAGRPREQSAVQSTTGQLVAEQTTAAEIRPDDDRVFVTERLFAESEENR